MKIFIGSSTEQRDRVREIAYWIEEAGHEALPWDGADLFLPGENTNTKLLEISKLVNAAVFIFAEDDHVWYRHDALRQPRDNVIFEYGLFCSSIGFRKCIICRHGKPKVPNDLAGLSFLDISDERKNEARLRFLSWTRTLSREDVDPAVIDLMGQRAVLKSEIDRLREQLEFEKKASTELREIVSRSRPSVSREWDLLFEFKFYRSFVDVIWDHYPTPGDWLGWLKENGFGKLCDMISWEHLSSKTHGRFFIAKTLNAIRIYDYGDTYKDLLDKFPGEIRSKVAVLVQSTPSPVPQ